MVIALIHAKGSAESQAGGNEGESNVYIHVVLGVAFDTSSGPYQLSLFFGDKKLLLQGQTVAWILEDSDDLMATFDGGVTIQPIVISYAELPVAAIDPCDHEQLVALTHLVVG